MTNGKKKVVHERKANFTKWIDLFYWFEEEAVYFLGGGEDLTTITTTPKRVKLTGAD